jgi:hypothetical protein
MFPPDIQVIPGDGRWVVRSYEICEDGTRKDRWDRVDTYEQARQWLEIGNCVMCWWNDSTTEEAKADQIREAVGGRDRR